MVFHAFHSSSFPTRTPAHATAAIAPAADQAEPAEVILDETEAAILQLSEQRITRGFVRLEEIVKSSFGPVDALLQQGQRVSGLATHFNRLDEMTSGLQPSDLIIVAGRPSMGKTAFAMNIAENGAMRDGKTVAVFSLEMAKEALFTRMLCSHAKINSHRLRTGTLWRDETPKVLSAMEELVQTPIYIDDSPGISLSEMRARRSLHHECTRFRRWWYSGDRPQILEPFLKTQQLLHNGDH